MVTNNREKIKKKIELASRIYFTWGIIIATMLWASVPFMTHLFSLPILTYQTIVLIFEITMIFIIYHKNKLKIW